MQSSLLSMELLYQTLDPKQCTVQIHQTESTSSAADDDDDRRMEEAVDDDDARRIEEKKSNRGMYFFSLNPLLFDFF